LYCTEPGCCADTGPPKPITKRDAEKTHLSPNFMKPPLHDTATFATRSIHADPPGGHCQYTDTFKAGLSRPPFRTKTFTPTFACEFVVYPSNHGTGVQ
jgi:hypothetical protein